MSKNYLLLITVIFMTACVGMCFAEKTNESMGSSDTGFSGTWIEHNNTLVLNGDGNVVTGTFKKEDGSVLDMEGNLSKDGKILKGKWLIDGKFIYNLSDDGKSYTGGFGYGSNESVVSESVWNKTKDANKTDKNSSWAGTWKTKTGDISTLTQKGDVVTGSCFEENISNSFLKGTVSEDGKVFSGAWNLTGLYSFTLSKDGKFFNGTFGYGSNSTSFPWNGIRSE